MKFTKIYDARGKSCFPKNTKRKAVLFCKNISNRQQEFRSNPPWHSVPNNSFINLDFKIKLYLNILYYYVDIIWLRMIVFRNNYYLSEISRKYVMASSLADDAPVINCQISTFLSVILKYYYTESYFAIIILYVIYINYAVNV